MKGSPISVYCASVRGQSHIKSGKPCQDRCCYEVFECGNANAAVIAVADGLGSASHSDIGADIAVHAAVAEIKRYLTTDFEDGLTLAEITPDETVLTDAISAAADAIEKYAENAANGVRKKDLACTLALLYYFKGKTAAAQVGDGAIVGCFSDGRTGVVVKPVDSEYINEVTPITAPDWRSRMNVAAGITAPEGLVSAAVFTDGCIGAVTVKKDGDIEAFEGFFAPLFRYFESYAGAEAGKGVDVESGVGVEVGDGVVGGNGVGVAENADIAQLLSSEKMCSVSDDDKTLAVICFGDDARRYLRINGDASDAKPDNSE